MAEGETLTVASKEGSVTNGGGGKIVATGSGDVFLAAAKFTEGAGTTSGSKPVIVDDGSTSYTGAGASAIAVHGEGTLSGTSSSGQTLSIESTGGENALEKVTGGFVNGGAVTLTNGDASGNNAELAVTRRDAHEQRHVDDRTGARRQPHAAGQNHEHRDDRDQREHLRQRRQRSARERRGPRSRKRRAADRIERKRVHERRGREHRGERQRRCADGTGHDVHGGSRARRAAPSR